MQGSSRLFVVLPTRCDKIRVGKEDLANDTSCPRVDGDGVGVCESGASE